MPEEEKKKIKTQIDTAAAKARQNNNNQAAKDTARAKARQGGGDGGTSARMSQREAAAGLNLRGNDPMAGRRTPVQQVGTQGDGINFTSTEMSAFGTEPSVEWQGYPVISKTSGGASPEFKIEFSELHVTDALSGGFISTKGGAGHEHAWEDISAGETFFLKIKTTDKNIPYEVEFKNAGGATRPANDGSEGVYYFPCAEVVADPNSTSALIPRILRSGGIDWFRDQDNSSSSNGGSDTSDTSGSGKDTAIVPAPWLSNDGVPRYAALFVEEQPEVIFSDHFSVDISVDQVTRAKLDPRFFDVCEEGSIKITGIVIDEPEPIGAWIDHDNAEIVIKTIQESVAKKATGRISGVRRGFAGVRMPSKTQEDFDANEAWLKRGNK